MILRIDNKFVCWDKSGTIAMIFFAKRRILSGINKSIFHCFCQILDFTKILIITGFFSSKQSMQGMMKIITPLCIQLISTFLTIPDNFVVIKIAFCYEMIYFVIFFGKFSNCKR